MSDLRSLDELRAHIRAALAPENVFLATVWGNPRAMSDMLRDVRRSLGDADLVDPRSDEVRASLHRFASTQAVSSFTELKYVCYGVSVPFGAAQHRIIDQSPLFDRLIHCVDERLSQPRQYRRCYQGLLNGYFGFEGEHTLPATSGENWTRLRHYLGERLPLVGEHAAARSQRAGWIEALEGHCNLLTDSPCSRYAQALVEGRTDELKAVCSSLGISSNSWVWDEALMAYVRAVCDAPDAGFKLQLSGVLNLVNGRSTLRLPEVLAKRSTALTVTRYAQCAERPEHPELRDTSLQWIGNPRVHQTSWDASVGNEPARLMVEGWLKRRLIRDFFEVLAQDGSADLRRLDYWLKWEAQITDMWFVLGGDARRNRGSAFVEVRKRMAGFDRVLAGNNDGNNAFVMRIGPMLVIEFGVVGNACYVFTASDFHTDLSKPGLSILELKQREGAVRLSHNHQWEHRFNTELTRKLRSSPGARAGDTRAADAIADISALLRDPSAVTDASLGSAWNAWNQAAASARSTPAAASTGTLTGAAPNSGGFWNEDFDRVQALCVQRGIEWEDNRPKGGALWVLLPDRAMHKPLVSVLERRYGFRFVQGKGFWLKTGG